MTYTLQLIVLLDQVKILEMDICECLSLIRLGFEWFLNTNVSNSYLLAQKGPYPLNKIWTSQVLFQKVRFSVAPVTYYRQQCWMLNVEILLNISAKTLTESRVNRNHYNVAQAQVWKEEIMSKDFWVSEKDFREIKLSPICLYYMSLPKQ